MMAIPYSLFSINDDIGAGGVDERRKNYVAPDQRLIESVEDQQWNFVAKKLASEDQYLRAKADHHQGSKGSRNFFTSSKPLALQNSIKPATPGYSKASKTSTSSSGKHKLQRGAISAQTEMVNSMVNKLLSLENNPGKLLAPSQKGLLSLTASPIAPSSISQAPIITSYSSSLDKRFKTLPPAESLPRNETLGGYIFVCNNDTMQEDLKRQLFGLPQRYRDSVRAIQPGLPLFLYNYTSHQLHGIFEAASFGGSNIDPTAWEDKKNKGESRFPAQVRIRVRRICKPLDEDAFRPILHHYDGPKFRLQLTVPETLALLDLLMGNGP